MSKRHWNKQEKIIRADEREKVLKCFEALISLIRGKDETKTK